MAMAVAMALSQGSSHNTTNNNYNSNNNNNKKKKQPLKALASWLRHQPAKIKTLLGASAAFIALIFIRIVVRDHDNLFIASEFIHSLGILVLVFKLSKEKNCSGLSLKSQELTALFLAVRLYCSFVMEYDIHTILDTAAFITTCWVIYTIRYKLKPTYRSGLDNFSNYLVVIPCAGLAFFIHPTTRHWIVNRIMWAFCVYLEALSVLPQLRVMQNTKVVEPFTAHYVFALGVARFLSCLHWIFQVLDTRGRLLVALGRGVWPIAVLVSEGVQTFILADFCFYYVKSVVRGESIMRLPTEIV